MAVRRACSLDDSILDKMLDSRLLGLNTLAMDGHLSLWIIAPLASGSIYKMGRPLQDKNDYREHKSV
jgi:hypothetical protein